MAPNLTIFVLVFACATTNAQQEPLQQACMKIREGSTSGFKHFVRPLILPQGQADWEMPVPKCRGESTGIDVTVCDDDKIPSVKITESSTVVVHRIGSLKSYTVVHITLYCLLPQPDSWIIPLPWIMK